MVAQRRSEVHHHAQLTVVGPGDDCAGIARHHLEGELDHGLAESVLLPLEREASRVAEEQGEIVVVLLGQDGPAGVVKNQCTPGVNGPTTPGDYS